MRKILALILAFAMCFLLLCSCGEQNRQNVIEIEGGKGVNINFIYLLTAMNKTMYSSAVEQGAGGNWDSAVYEDGTTWADLLKAVVLEDAGNLLICEHLFDKVYNLKLTDENNKLIDEQMEAYVASCGSEKELETQLSAYSADKNTLRRYLELVVKQMNLQNYLYGTEGIAKISDEAVKQTFAEEYAIVTHIYFNTVTVTKADGTIISMSEEEAAQKKMLAENVYNSIIAGEDFYTLKEQYTEDVYESEYYPNGFFVTGDSTFPAAFTTAALEMKVGEYKLIDSGNGLHILYKLPMNSELYNSDKEVYNTIYSRLMSADFSNIFDEYEEMVEINEEQFSKIEAISVQNVPAFTLFIQ